jgi:sugar phosphate isomerase/epimerase
MKQISISTCFNYKLPIERQLPLIAKAGFSHFSLGINLAHFDCRVAGNRERLRELMNDYSLLIDTIHGPQLDKASTADLVAMAESAASLNAPVIVVHGGAFEFEQDELLPRLKRLKQTCKELDRISKDTGITFALENVSPGPATDLVRRVILETSYSGVGFCYDSSHDQIGGPRPFDLLSELGSRLVSVHLSDILGGFADHLIPGEGFIDWKGLCSILRQLEIRFPLLLEVETEYAAEKDSAMFLQTAFESASDLYNRIFA